jgi:hypothetical protein
MANGARDRIGRVLAGDWDLGRGGQGSTRARLVDSTNRVACAATRGDHPEICQVGLIRAINCPLPTGKFRTLIGCVRFADLDSCARPSATQREGDDETTRHAQPVRSAGG